MYCISYAPEQDEAVCETEQNMTSSDQKEHGLWCRWKSRPTKRQLERELQALKATNADQAKEIRELRGKLEEVVSLRDEWLDAVNELKDQVNELKWKNNLLTSKNHKYALEISEYI